MKKGLVHEHCITGSNLHLMKEQRVTETGLISYRTGAEGRGGLSSPSHAQETVGRKKSTATAALIKIATIIYRVAAG